MATPEDTDEKTKKTIVLAIVTSKAKTGMTADEIFAEYVEREGQRLMTKKSDAVNFLNSIDTLELRNGRYFNYSKLSSHVRLLVEREKDDKPNNNRINNGGFNGAYRGRYPNHYQPSFSRDIPHRRKSVCYDQEYIEEVKAPAPAPVAGKIARRRMTMGAQELHFRPDTPPRSRSRSKSPARNDTFGRSHKIQNDKRSRSPDPRSKRPRDRSPGSPTAKRFRRSRSPSRDRRQNRPRSRSPRRDPRRRPISNSRSPIDPRRDSQTQRPPIIERVNGITAGTQPNIAALSLKFNIVGDGLMYHVVHELDANATFNSGLIWPDLLMANAIQSVKTYYLPKIQKKKCVILSIGTTDLRQGTSLIDMRKQFVTLYQMCKNNGLKPLVTTISCMETQELIQKAKIFNDFLKQNFTNVIDLFNTVNGADGGLANKLASLRPGPAKSSENRAILSIGRRSRLVLRVGLKNV